MSEEATQPDTSGVAPMQMDNDGTDDIGDKNDTAMQDDTNPLDDLDETVLKELTDNMGFSLLRAQKGLLYGNEKTVESAVEWLLQHQDDDDIDTPIDIEALKREKNEQAVVAQSYKCNECGRILSNMANLELHANKTGHSDFEESTESVKPLTEEEKQAKILEIKQLLKAKRTEREHQEKEEQIVREKQRREMGKNMHKTREQLEQEQRKREAAQRKREKDDFRRERERIRAELAKDKAERAAQGGKLSSRLGVDGYNPDGIQYDVDVPHDATAASSVTGSGDDATEDLVQKQKKLKANSGRIDEYISKVMSYKAGGDGGRCLKVLKAYVGNVIDHPEEEKFKSINTENKAYKLRVKQLIGARNLLMAVGFQPNSSGTALVIADEDIDKQLLQVTREKLDKAIEVYENS